MNNEKLSEITIYCRVKLFGQEVGIKAKLGTFKSGCEKTYSEILKLFPPEKLPELLMLPINPEDITAITPEEYERDFDSEDEEDEQEEDPEDE